MQCSSALWLTSPRGQLSRACRLRRATRRSAGAEAGRGNASQAWEEFKPYKRENKHTRARDAARASYGSSFDASFDQADGGLPPLR